VWSIYHGFLPVEYFLLLKGVFRSKLTLAACSRDGVVKILKFTDNEIGHMLSINETVFSI
jgi:hypothetical protein